MWYTCFVLEDQNNCPSSLGSYTSKGFDKIGVKCKPINIHHTSSHQSKFIGRTERDKTNIANGTTDPRHWALYLIQHLKFKAEASTSFGILTKLKLTFFGKGRKVHRTLTNPFCNLEISIRVKILNQILNLMSYLKKSQYRSQKIWFWKKAQSRSQKI